MDKLFLTVLNMSLTGAFVIAAVMLARLPLKKAPKIISYCLWAVVGFRLICPFAIESVFSFIPFETQQISDTRLLDENISFSATMGTVNQAIGDVANGGLGILHITTGHEPDGTRIITQSLHHEYWLLFFSKIWFPGALVMILYGIISYVLLKRRMQTAIRVEENMYETDNIGSPFVLGIIKPKIFLPLFLAGSERDYIILHERTHIRRHDHIIKFAAYFILCLHWFNPLVWAAFLLMSVDMEISCDERVLKEMGGGAKHDYSRSLLSLATQRRVIGGSPLAFGEGGVKERVKNILNFRKPPRIIIITSVVLVAVLSVGFAMNRVIGVDRAFPMQGVNLSDLQPEDIIGSIVKITGATNDAVHVPGYNNFQIDVSSNFDWQLSGTISIMVSKSKTDSGFYHDCQLRVFPDEQEFYVTETKWQEPPQKHFHLRDYLNALKYLPQEYIRSLMHDNPDKYIINFMDGGVPNDNQPCVYYGSNGVGKEYDWRIRFDIQPLYHDEDGTGYHGVGSDVIHLFYNGTTENSYLPVDEAVRDITTLDETQEIINVHYPNALDVTYPGDETISYTNPSMPVDSYIFEVHVPPSHPVPVGASSGSFRVAVTKERGIVFAPEARKSPPNP